MLANPPTHINIVFCVAPVSLGVQVAEVQFLLLTKRNLGYSTGNLACHERLTTPWAFMIEENAIGGMHTISFTIVDNDPISIELGSGWETTNVKWQAKGSQEQLSKKNALSHIFRPYLTLHGIVINVLRFVVFFGV